ncbi:MAG: secretion protein HylD [Proteobacteria bacterium]|nr:MAG: secretion protein HylD [Pseudomonadota bacterium]
MNETATTKVARRGGTEGRKPTQEVSEADPGGKRMLPSKAPPETDGQGTAAGSSPRQLLHRHPFIVAALAVLAILAAAGTVIWWLEARRYETTDDAFIYARTVSISSQVNGAIVAIAATDNQLVEVGGVLARIDDRDYKAALDQAKAQVDQAQATLVSLTAQVDAQQARVDQAEKQVAEAQAALRFSEEENARYQDLAQKGAGTLQRAQQASSDLGQKRAELAAAQANATATDKQIAVLTTQKQVAAAQLEQANSAREQAETNLSRTVITAPVAGWATNISAAKGAYAQVGQALMMFVPSELWITANFKETQLNHIRLGQEVDIAVDSYPNQHFHGHVDSIQAGSGAAFSLLPPENATGNYVKVVQRVPVKIVFDRPPQVHLGPGMSVVPSVKVR